VEIIRVPDSVFSLVLPQVTCDSRDRCFLKNQYSMGNKILIIMKIFKKLEHLKNQGVIFWLEGKRLLVVQVFDQLQNAVKMTGYRSFLNNLEIIM